MTEPNSLEHFGVKGMKWGVRRYQNEDGTLTDAGKKRLQNYKDKEYTRVSKRRDKAQDKYETARHKRKGRGLTRETSRELRNKAKLNAYKKELEVIKQMNYKDMQSDKVAAGKAWAKSAARTAIGSTLLSSLSPGTLLFLDYSPLVGSVSDAKTRNRLKRANY